MTCASGSVGAIVKMVAKSLVSSLVKRLARPQTKKDWCKLQKEKWRVGNLLIVLHGNYVPCIFLHIV